MRLRAVGVDLDRRRPQQEPRRRRNDAVGDAQRPDEDPVEVEPVSRTRIPCGEADSVDVVTRDHAAIGEDQARIASAAPSVIRSSSDVTTLPASGPSRTVTRSVLTAPVFRAARRERCPRQKDGRQRPDLRRPRFRGVVGQQERDDRRRLENSRRDERRDRRDRAPRPGFVGLRVNRGQGTAPSGHPAARLVLAFADGHDARARFRRRSPRP